MDHRLPALLFGACLLLLGCWMLKSQLAAGRRRAQEPMDKLEREFYRRQHRRRLQVAGLIIVIAIMIPVGDSLIPWENAVATFAIYWMTVLGLTFWTMLLAVGDLLSTKMYSDFSLHRLQRQRLELEETARKLREAQRNRDSLN